MGSRVGIVVSVLLVLFWRAGLSAVEMLSLAVFLALGAVVLVASVSGSRQSAFGSRVALVVGPRGAAVTDEF
jgi:hypothetical protein